MKILTREQIYQADKITIQKQKITSDMLMERAATAAFNWIHQRLQGAPVPIHIFCGIGNNGGDGLVIARHLKEHGYHVQVFIVNYSDTRSEDFLKNLDRIKDRKLWPVTLSEESDFPEIKRDDILIDAIFGIGLNRPPAPWVENLMKRMNESQVFILSIDIPSGMYMDQATRHEVIQANTVLSFQTPKLVFFLPETGRHIQQYEVLDIGLDAEFMHRTEAIYELSGKTEVLMRYQPRTKFSHKGTYGHALLIGGSQGKIGAIALSSKACLKAGAGLVTAYVPECGVLPLQSSLHEIMVLADPGTAFLTAIAPELEPTVVGIGPGMGDSEKTLEAFGTFLKRRKQPLVIDADALNFLAKKKTLLKDVPPDSVLTPHPKELERLIGAWEDDFDKLRKAMKFASKYKLVLLIKGAHTLIFSGSKIYINQTGNPGMATAGSGDVLTGIITALIGQGYSSEDAAIMGVYLHGKAGDLQVQQTGYQALTATDICEGIGKAYMDLFVVEHPAPPETENKS